MYKRKAIAWSLCICCILGFVSLSVKADFGGRAIGISSSHFYAPPALESLIQKNITQKKYKAASSILDEQLSKDPKNTALLFDRAAIYADLGEYDKSMDVLDQIAVLQPDNEKANKLRKVIAEKQKAIPRNELGFYQDENYVSDLKSYWSYSSLHYYRFTKHGTFGGRVNYANRYGTPGEQYQLEAYPKLFEGAYATLSFALSNTSQRVYPHYQYTVEPYFSLPRTNFEVSLGQRYIKSYGVNIYTYTGSVAYYLNNYFIWFRPYHYTPKSTDYFELGIRRYSDDDTNKYFSIKAGIGKYPDIGDFPPLNQIIIVSANSIGFDGKYPLTKTLFLQGWVGYIRQVYHSGLVREVTDGALGINWQF